MPKASKTSKSKSKKEDKAKKEVDKVKETKVDKHPGYACLYLGDKELQGYGFKTGDGLLDVAAFKTLKKTEILEEIQFKGKMCAFAPFRECIDSYEQEELLFVWDADEQKEAECNFYFCTNAETLQAEKQRLGITDDAMSGVSAEELQRIQREKEEEARQIQLEQERVMEEERIATAIAELKKPLEVRAWTDLGSFAEIEESRVKWSRPAHKLCISKRRKCFGDSVRFSDQENVNSMNVEIKSAAQGGAASKSSYDVYRVLVDRNVQIGETRTEQATQTPWNRKVNKIVQYEPNEASIQRQDNKQSAAAAAVACQTQTDSIDNFYGLGFECGDGKNGDDVDDDDQKTMSNAAAPGSAEGAMEQNERLEQFLDDVYGDVYEVLSNNAMVNIFEDDFAKFVRDEHGLELDTKTESIKEIQTFVDLHWSRGKKISDIHWMPSSSVTSENDTATTMTTLMDGNNIVAVSCVENMSFDERVNIMNKSRVSAILLWNLSHVLLKAQVVLTAPADIFTFKFHPTNKNIIIGGLETGQVALWDLNDYYVQQQAPKLQQRQTMSATAAAADDDDGGDLNATSPMKQRLKPSTADIGDDEDDEKVVQIAPKMLSYIEKSHIKRVTDLLWLPSNVAVSAVGALRYIDLANRPKMAKLYEEEQFMSVAGDGSILFWDIQIPKQTEKEKKKNESAKWVPLYSIRVDKKGLLQNLFTDRDAMEAAKYDPNCKPDADDEDGVKDDNDDNNDDEEDSKGDKEQESILVNKLCYTPLSGRVVICTELGEYALFNFGKLDAAFIQQQQQSSIVDMSVPSTHSVLRKHPTSQDSNPGNNDTDNNSNHKEDLEQFQLQLQHSLLRHSRLQKQHFLDVKSVCVSPHFCDIYLTFGDWRFCIWRNNQLLFTSPYSDAYICCGCWSPTRPAVVITAKYDGSMDVWDLLDQTYSPVIKSSPVSSMAITSITFSPSAKLAKNGVQQLAVGDCNGNLRILQIPRNLAIPLNNEDVLMAQFYQKEYVRIQFINRRYKLNKRNTLELEKMQKELREIERQRRDQQQQDASAEMWSGATDENELQRQAEQESNAKLEAKYEKMLIAFKKQLSIEK